MRTAHYTLSVSIEFRPMRVCRAPLCDIPLVKTREFKCVASYRGAPQEFTLHVSFEIADAPLLTFRHCTNVTLRLEHFRAIQGQTLKKALQVLRRRAPFPHERSRRSPSSAVRPFCLANPHTRCAFNTCFCSNPASLWQFADPEFARYEQRWDGRSISGHGKFLRAGKLSFPLSRRLQYCHHDIGGAVYELLPPSEHTSAPSGDSAVRCRTLELGADSRGASDARETILGRCARIEWPN